MKNVVKVLCFSLVLFLLAAGAAKHAEADSNLDFQLYNRSGVDIYELYIAPTGSDSWEDDLLDGNVLKNGGDMPILFDGNAGAGTVNWDILVRDKDGNELWWEKINLTEVSEVILEKDGYARCK